MFTGFFYLLRQEGIPVSLTEWMTFIEALSKGLAGSTLSGFYHLGRTILIKSESNLDRFDLAFYRYFQGIEQNEELLRQVRDWLEQPLPPRGFSEEERAALIGKLGLPDFDALRKALEERLRTQDGAHHGGSNWIGTGGTSPFGHSGFHPGGIRIGGESHSRSAVKVAGERHYRGYRTDETLGVRQFEVALRRLRQFSTRLDGPKEELDLEETIQATCHNAGRLELVWTRPRKNTVKVLVLMDVGGSMTPYAKICSQLFSAVHKATHFKDLQFYYFHNCVYENLYLDSDCSPYRSVPTEAVLHNLGSDYKLILVGDAAMAPSELLMPGGNIYWEISNNEPGITWLERLARHFPYNAWLNPIPSQHWDRIFGYQTLEQVKQVFPMYELTLEGLDLAVKKLMVRQ